MKHFCYLLYTLIISSSFVILQSCSKVDANLRIEDIINNNRPGDTTIWNPSITVSTKNFVDVINFKSTSKDEALSLNKDAIVHVLFYKESHIPDKNKVYYKNIYHVKKSGLLVPIYNDIQIKPGIYNLYALSTNDSLLDRVPDFEASTGKSKYLYNGIDYLWGQQSKVEIKDNSPIHFDLDHTGCKLAFRVQTDLNDTIKILKATLTSSTESECHLSITTGLIKPATTATSNQPLHIEGLYMHGIILPLLIEDPLFLSLTISINDKDFQYKLPIESPTGKIFQFGYTYTYDIMLDKQGVSIINNQ